MYPDMDTVELDTERKKELVMEKRLRAARVNIIPRVWNIFSDIFSSYIFQLEWRIFLRARYSTSS
jgi:hypothetical protein